MPEKSGESYGSKGYTAASNVKADQEGKATWKWTAKNILDFAWAADRDYSVDEFTVLGHLKSILSIRNRKNKILGRS